MKLFNMTAALKAKYMEGGCGSVLSVEPTEVQFFHSKLISR